MSPLTDRPFSDAPRHPDYAFADIRAAFADDNTLKLPNALTGEAAAAIAVMEVVTRSVYGRGDNRVVVAVHKIKAVDKLRALELLSKHLGLFRDLADHAGAVGLTEEMCSRTSDEDLETVSELVKMFRTVVAKYSDLNEAR